MRKNTLIILGILGIFMFVAGATFSYFTSSVSSTNGIIVNSSNLNVVYSGGVAINGTINVGTSKDSGKSTSVNISLGEGSVVVNSDIYLSITSISAALATEAFKWEVYKVSNETETLYGSGNFKECYASDTTTKTCAANDKLYLVKNYTLSTTVTQFKIYLWVDSTLSSNDVIGGKLTGTILAESSKFGASFS